MRVNPTGWLANAAACGLILWGSAFAGGTACAEGAPPFAAEVTNVLQLARMGSSNSDVSHSLRLEGSVWWASPAQGRFVLKDSSGAEALEINLPGQLVQTGQRVRLEGHGTIARRAAAFRIGANGPVVDNNGVHAMIEKAGSVYLKAGRQPLRVEWFNGVDKRGLTLEYEGPNLPRQRIGDTALFRGQADAPNNPATGLDFRCYEIIGELLPDFSQLTPVKIGATANFDLGITPHEEHVGAQFTGWLAVPQDGLYTFHLTSDDGSRLFVGEPSMRVTVTGSGSFPEPRPIAIGQILREEEAGQWGEVEGKVTFASEQLVGMRLELSAGAGRLQVEVADSAGLSAVGLLNRRLRAVGFCQSASTTDRQLVPGVLLVPGAKQITLIEPATEPVATVNVPASALPVLTTAAEVHLLKREEAERGYPVKLRGVVTCVLPEHQAVILQDATRGVYVVDVSANRSGPPEIGEFLEVEGVTDPSLFAPIVNARRLTSLGAGHLPESVRPTWDQLLNGSLDAQYVEIQGIVTAVQSEGVALLTRGGVLKAELRVNGLKLDQLRQFENALVRVRGCLFASWDYLTHQVKMDEVRIYGAEILVDQPAPADLFSTPRKTAAELRLFDPQAGVFQRVKVAGQIVHVRDAEYLMMDGGHGLRFVTKQPASLKVGDEVEVVGFPDLTGTVSPVVREAVARQTGHAALPPPKKLNEDGLINADHDSTRVRVEGKLVNARRSQTDQVLEMQSGVRSFVARLAGGAALVPAPIGSRLELTGVYAGLGGGNRATGRDIASFELWLDSPADIKVLARPSWWTLERLLFTMGALACVLAVTVLWITLLHRKVEERTAELEKQIQERQRVEHQRAMEEERARIAQDLHDELGSDLTEISMLVTRARSAVAPEEKRAGYMEQMGDKTRQMVTALDEIVWAMNPGHNSLASLVSYFCLYAERFLGLANMTWRLEESSGSPDQPVDSRCRHQLFLAFKEALTNVVRHSNATEVRLSIQLEAGQVRLTITDNGRGVPTGKHTEEMDGVANMRARIEKLGGRFEMASESQRGTTLRFHVPAN